MDAGRGAPGGGGKAGFYPFFRPSQSQYTSLRTAKPVDAGRRDREKTLYGLCGAAGRPRSGPWGPENLTGRFRARRRRSGRRSACKDDSAGPKSRCVARVSRAWTTRRVPRGAWPRREQKFRVCLVRKQLYEPQKQVRRTCFLCAGNSVGAGRLYFKTKHIIPCLFKWVCRAQYVFGN